MEIEVRENRTTTAKAAPLILRRDYRRDDHGEPTDEVSVMLEGISISRQRGWPKATADELRQMAAACVLLADQMENG